jgi:HPt (histidine-containing phosphotransfer) domain-containing protein
LFDVIEQCVGPCSRDCIQVDDENDTMSSPTSVVDALEPGDENVIDVKAALDLCCGDDAKVRSLAATLLDECTCLMGSLRDAASSSNTDSIRGYAHSLKGAASVFNAIDVVDSALHLEMVGANGDAADVQSALQGLEQHADRLIHVLKKICR